MAQQLKGGLGTGKALELTTGSMAENEAVLESIGRDLLVFLAASVAVAPVSKKLGITPILGYLLMGAALGPHGLDMFSNR